MKLLSTLKVSGIWSAITTGDDAALESDLQDTVDWGREWLVDFNAGKNKLVSFDQSNNIKLI